MAIPNNITDADIILYRSKSLLGKVIRLFDGRPVNHAGLYLGNTEIGEALGNGIRERPFDKSVRGNEWVIARRLKTPPASMWPVVSRAGYYLQRKERYAYEELLLLAVLSLTRKLKVNRFLRPLLRHLLDSASEVLLKLVPTKKEPMICSEFVFRCYEEAQPGSSDPYTLWIGGSQPVGAPVTATAAPGATFSRRPGTAHPDCLLAWFQNVSTTGRVGATSPTLLLATEESYDSLGAAAGAEEPDEAADMDLNQLMEAYLADVEAPPPPPERMMMAGAAPETEAAIHTPDVYAAINHFLGAYHLAARPVQSSAPEEDEPVRLFASAEEAASEAPARLGATIRPIADFVTPGDLYECHNLYTVGQIYPRKAKKK